MKLSGAGPTPSRGRGGNPPRQGDQRPGDAGQEALRSAFAGGVQQIDYMTRRGKVRIGVVPASGGPSPAAMIYVPDEGNVYTVLPTVSMYTETALADISAAVREPPAGGAAPVVPTVTHTKQFELVAGHKCEHVVVAVANEKTDICMAKGLGVFIMPAAFGRAAAWQRAMTEANGFPLRVLQTNGTVTMEVTKIERKALPETLFTVPDSYTRMNDLIRRPPG